MKYIIKNHTYIIESMEFYYSVQIEVHQLNWNSKDILSSILNHAKVMDSIPREQTDRYNSAWMHMKHCHIINDS